jgi:mitogen-activated protein kinase organizer 1
MNLQSVLVGHTGPVNAVRWTKDGNYCLSASDDRTVKLWNPHKICPPSFSAAAAADTKSATVGQAPQIKSYAGAHGYAIQDVAVFHDNTRFVSGGKDRTLFVWDVTSGAVIRRISAHDNVNALALNATSTVVLSASYDQTVRLWDLRSQGRQAIQTLNDFRDSVTSVSITGHTVRAARTYVACWGLPQHSEYAMLCHAHCKYFVELTLSLSDYCCNCLQPAPTLTQLVDPCGLRGRSSASV